MLQNLSTLELVHWFEERKEGKKLTGCVGFVELRCGSDSDNQEEEAE